MRFWSEQSESLNSEQPSACVNLISLLAFIIFAFILVHWLVRHSEQPVRDFFHWLCSVMSRRWPTISLVFRAFRKGMIMREREWPLLMKWTFASSIACLPWRWGGKARKEPKRMKTAVCLGAGGPQRPNKPASLIKLPEANGGGCISEQLDVIGGERNNWRKWDSSIVIGRLSKILAHHGMVVQSENNGLEGKTKQNRRVALRDCVHTEISVSQREESLFRTGRAI